MAAADLKQQIRAFGLTLGLAELRFTSADDVAGAAAALDVFLAEGRHGEMNWLASTRDRRVSPRVITAPAR